MSDKNGILSENMQGFLSGFNKHAQGKLGELQRQAYKDGIPIITQDVVQYLTIMLNIKKPMRVLEIGCAIGFSASLFASLVPAGGKVTTIDRYELMTTRAKENFAKLGFNDKIELIEEDAATVLPRLVEEGKQFDFIFMDCGKGQYSRFFVHIKKLLAPGGIFCTDDIFQDGDVALEFEEIVKRQRTIYRNLREFLDAVTSDDELDTVILPIGDGLLVSHKRG